jgi:hypothetical protein
MRLHFFKLLLPVFLLACITACKKETALSEDYDPAVYYQDNGTFFSGTIPMYFPPTLNDTLVFNYHYLRIGNDLTENDSLQKFQMYVIANRIGSAAMNFSINKNTTIVRLDYLALDARKYDPDGKLLWFYESYLFNKNDTIISDNPVLKNVQYFSGIRTCTGEVYWDYHKVKSKFKIVF